MDGGKITRRYIIIYSFVLFIRVHKYTCISDGFKRKKAQAAYDDIKGPNNYEDWGLGPFFSVKSAPHLYIVQLIHYNNIYIRLYYVRFSSFNLNLTLPQSKWPENRLNTNILQIIMHNIISRSQLLHSINTK